MIFFAENKPRPVDFEGVDVFTPSWGDEFLTPLKHKYGNAVKFINDENASVQATLEVLFSDFS